MKVLTEAVNLELLLPRGDLFIPGSAAVFCGGEPCVTVAERDEASTMDGETALEGGMRSTNARVDGYGVAACGRPSGGEAA